METKGGGVGWGWGGGGTLHPQMSVHSSVLSVCVFCVVVWCGALLLCCVVVWCGGVCGVVCCGVVWCGVLGVWGRTGGNLSVVYCLQLFCFLLYNRYS